MSSKSHGLTLRKFAERDGKAFQDFDEQVQSLLMNYSWPGNIRQLQNVVRNIVVLHDGPLVTMNMMPPLEQVVAKQGQLQPLSVGGGVLPPRELNKCTVNACNHSTLSDADYTGECGRGGR